MISKEGTGSPTAPSPFPRFLKFEDTTVRSTVQRYKGTVQYNGRVDTEQRAPRSQLAGKVSREDRGQLTRRISRSLAPLTMG